MFIGRMRDTASFYRLNSTADAYGNATSGFAATPFLTRRGHLEISLGGERDEAGRLQSEVGAVLTVRADNETETVTEADKVTIDGVDFQIRAIVNVDRKGRFLRMRLERGVAV